MVKNNKTIEEINNNKDYFKEERLQITIEEYNYNNYVEYINRKAKEKDEDPPRVIIIDL